MALAVGILANSYAATTFATYGEAIVIAPIDVTELRYARVTRATRPIGKKSHILSRVTLTNAGGVRHNSSVGSVRRS